VIDGINIANSQSVRSCNPHFLNSRKRLVANMRSKITDPRRNLSRRLPKPARGPRLLSVPRPPTSSGAALGRTATSRASTPAFAMSCSTARSSTLCARPRSSSRAGDATTTRSGPTPQSDTSHQHQRCSCLHSPRGRLRYADRLRRPRWRNGQP
jgi:hypothetical protein